MQQNTTITQLAAAQLDEAAAVLSRAFQHDPLLHYLYPNIAKAPESPARFYQATIRLGLRQGVVQATPGMEGVAVWISPGNTDFSFGVLFRTGFMTAVLSAGLRSLGRFMKMASYMEEVNKPITDRLHWHLMMLGVEPAMQGNGLGGILMQPILARADAESFPCILESGNERNLNFYRRYGFEEAALVQIPDGGPQVWVMVREPGQRREGAQ